MGISLETVKWLFYIFSAISVFLLLLVFYFKYRYKSYDDRVEQMNAFIIRKFANYPQKKKIRRPNLFIHQYMSICQSLTLSDSLEKKIVDYFEWKGRIKRYIKQLNSSREQNRIRAATYLGRLKTHDARRALEEALSTEKKYLVKIYIANGLDQIMHKESIPYIVSSLIGAPEWYAEKVRVLMAEYGVLLHNFFLENIQCEEEAIQKLFCEFALNYKSQQLKDYLLQLVRKAPKEISLMAIKALGENYPQEIVVKEFYDHADDDLRNIVIKSLTKIPSRDIIDIIVSEFNNEKSERYAKFAIAEILRKHPEYVEFVIDKYHDAPDHSLVRHNLAEVLANRVEYFMFKLLEREKKYIKLIVEEIIEVRKTSELIGFVNRNTNPVIEKELLSVIRKSIKKHEEVKEEFQLYLNDRILEKLKLERVFPETKRKEPVKEKQKSIRLRATLAGLISIFIILFGLRHIDEIGVKSFRELTEIYILDFSYYLVYYSGAINMLYVAILLFSAIGAAKQFRMWNMKRESFLFKKSILPSISILAPAYNEEASIIESTNALLNLKYPEYELIVINDGSSDHTLNKLIENFHLERVDVMYEEELHTQPIRGIYKNKDIPKLTVVDKSNGGKADSLNAGINISIEDYLCGIDADSLIEPEALLKMASIILNTEDETIAVGGNIFPVNGCTVHMGKLEKIRIPKNYLARFQNIEYLRAFMTGRLGWAYLDSLLIISGAFGLFKKSRVIEAGGYLTSNERFKKDTVGEDMELVVRLSEYMHQKGIRHKINYAYNANCWTEVPESWKVFYRQRDRWQRGLIDIIFFHSKSIANPKYGKMGLIAMPYFYLFEMVGPLIEAKGYLMVILAACLGLINQKLALLLFIASVLFGIVVSVSALVIAEREIKYYSTKEIFLLTFYAFIENFGFRQIVSFFRVTGYFSAIRQSRGWGKMDHKGFLPRKKRDKQKV